MKPVFLSLLSAVGLWFLSSSALSEPPSAEQGRTLYSGCVVCHGERAEGNVAMNAPALQGQSAAYLLRQLEHFKSGLRGAKPSDSTGAQMRGMVSLLKNSEEMKLVANYIAGLAVTPSHELAAKQPEAQNRGDVRRGQNLYQGNCGACHGGTAEGNTLLNAPRLAGLDRGYIKQQMLLYQQGLRGYDKADRFGRQMAMMAKTLTDDKSLDDVIAYIHKVNR